MALFLAHDRSGRGTITPEHLPARAHAPDAGPAEAPSLDKALEADADVDVAPVGRVLRRDSSGLPGVVVRLETAADGQVFAEAVTDLGGRFRFDDPGLGKFRVAVDTTSLPPRHRMAGPASESSIAWRPGQPVEFRVGAAASLEGTVWEDRDGDGDPVGDPVATFGLSGVTVTLHRASGEAVAETVTRDTGDNLGHFEFHDLGPGAYEIRVDPAELGARALPAPTTPATRRVRLAEGGHSATNHFGFRISDRPVLLGDFSAESEGDAVRLRWRTTWEQDTVGFIVHRIGADGSPAPMTRAPVAALGTGGEYEVLLENTGGGTFALERVGLDLERELCGERAVTQAPAGPRAGGEVLMVMAVDGEVELLTSDYFANYFVIGFEDAPVVEDLTDENAVRRLRGEGLTIHDDHGVYFSVEPGRRILVNAPN